jgi:hypothetical protein
MAHAARHGIASALSKYGIKHAGFNPHMPIPVTRAGVMSTSSARPTVPSTAIANPVTSSPAGPSILDRGRAIGQQIGGATNRFMRSATRPLALMGVGALGASMLHHGRAHDDGQLAYSPLPGSFIQ